LAKAIYTSMAGSISFCGSPAMRDILVEHARRKAGPNAWWPQNGLTG